LTRPIGTPFLVSVCGGPKLPQGRPSFRGRRLLGRSSPWTISENVMLLNRYCMCKKTEESMDHLLLHCDVASALWYSLFSRFGLSWVMPQRVIDLLACWWSSDWSRSATAGKMAPTCLFWCLWGERDNRNFGTWRRPLRNFYPPSITLCIFGLRLMCSPYPLAFLISLLVSLIMRFLLYTTNVLRGASLF